MSSNTELPRWDLSQIYPAIESAEFKQANTKLAQWINELEKYIVDNQIDPQIPSSPIPDSELAEIIAGFLDRLNQIRTTTDTLESYLFSIVYTDSYNQEVKKALSEFEAVKVQLDQLSNVIFKGWLGKIGSRMEEIIPINQTLIDHRFMLRETVDQSRYLMSPAEEDLAGQLSISGINAWSKLQNDIVSQTKWEIEGEDGRVDRLPITAIINLYNHEEEAMRRRAYDAEMAAWKTVETPLAAALNGVKGAQSLIDRRRGRMDSLHASTDFARIDQQTLETMLAAVKDFFPVIRQYYKAKARLLGKDSLPWWDLTAPIGKMERAFTYPEAQNFILETFSKFSEELAEHTRNAFEQNWIDVAPRDGKSTGAFCAQMPAVKQCRIMLNYAGTLSSAITFAHELGHGYHFQCLFQHPILLQTTPLTLAETASIMSESLVADAAIKLAVSPQEKLAILGSALMREGAMVVDIYSRYLFEKEVLTRRARAELSAEEFNEIMAWAQGETYGEALDPDYRHKYMWTWKPHYYWPVQAFYNYQYTFGMLFAKGLYAIYQHRGAEFAADYKALLGSTGLGSAVELASRFNIDLHSPAFWGDSLKMIGHRVDQFLELEQSLAPMESETTQG